MTSTASARMPARSSTSASGTPRQRVTPIAPRPQAVPGTCMFCCSGNSERPLPAHSMATVRSTDGSAVSSS